MLLIEQINPRLVPSELFRGSADMVRHGHPGHSEVARLIEQARADAATELDSCLWAPLTERPAAIGQLSELQSL